MAFKGFYTGPLSYRFIVDVADVAAIIGKGGETIRSISRESGVKVFIQEWSPSSPDTLPAVVIEGRSPSDEGGVAYASRMVAHIAAQSRHKRLEENFYKSSFTTRLYVGSEDAGMIIGRKGATINGIARQYGVKAYLEKHQPDGVRACTQNEACFVICGNRKSVMFVKAKFEDIVEISQRRIEDGSAPPRLNTTADFERAQEENYQNLLKGEQKMSSIYDDDYTLQHYREEDEEEVQRRLEEEEESMKKNSKDKVTFADGTKDTKNTKVIKKKDTKNTKDMTATRIIR